jgi:hypothetical protein
MRWRFSSLMLGRQFQTSNCGDVSNSFLTFGVFQPACLKI